MQRFRSKIDTRLVVVFGLLVLSPPIVLLAALAGGKLDVGMGIILAFSAVIEWGVFAFIFPMRYDITDTVLIVRAGLLHWSVPLAEITDVRPTRNPRSSPALSVDRLDVRYGASQFVLISPAERGTFLDALAARANLVHDGDGLHRVAPSTLGQAEPSQRDVS